MAISDEISRLQTAKNAIKMAINLKGVTVPDGVTLSYYDTYISQIETQGLYEIKQVTPNAEGQTVTPSAGFDALSQVIINGDLNLVPENIANGVTIFGVTGTLQATGKTQAKTVTPTASGLTVTPDSGYDGLSSVSVVGDNNLVPQNIVDGVTIFGVTGTGVGGGVSGSNELNVYVQNSEPASKDGIWIKDNGGSGTSYLSPIGSKKGEFGATSSYEGMKAPASMVGQVIVGDYLYSFGMSSSTSFKYDLRSRTLVGNLNTTTITPSTSGTTGLLGAYYCEETRSIIVVWKYTYSATGNHTRYYEYFIDTDTCTPETDFRYAGQSQYTSVSIGCANNKICVFGKNGNVSVMDMVTKQFFDRISNNTSATLFTNRMTTSLGTKIYIGVGSSEIYEYDVEVNTMTYHKLSEPAYSVSSYFAIGGYIYIFNRSTPTSDEKAYEYMKVDISNWQVEKVQILNGYKFVYSSTENRNSIVYDAIRGIMLYRTSSSTIYPLQLGDGINITGLKSGDAVILQDLAHLRPVQIIDNPAITIGVFDTFIYDNGELDGNHLAFWGNGYSWNLLKNPNSETVTVTFDANGGSAVESKEVVVGTTVERPTTTKAGYIFVDWTLNGQSYDFSSPVVGNITLVAQWLENKVEFIDYIELTGTQYIDTGIPIAPNLYIDADVAITSTPAVGTLMGTTTSAESYRFWVCTFQQDTLRPNCGLMENAISETNLLYNTKYNIYVKFFDGEQKLYVDDILHCSASNTSTAAAQEAWNTQGNLLIGKANYSTTNYLYGKIYSFKMYDENHVLTRSFKPCKDVFGVVCLYDEVTGTCFYNQGTTDFIGGVTEDLNDLTQLNYIESTGTQYIDTGFKPNPTTTKVEVKMAFTNNAVSTQGVFGARPTSSGLDTGSCNLFWNIDVGKVRPDWCGEHNNAYSVEVALNEPILITCENRTVTIDGTQKTGSFTKGTDYLDYSMYIGSFNNAGSMYQQGVYAKWYYFKIYDNGTLIRDYIPVLDKDGVVCLYDKVSETCFYNAGTGTFTGE